MIVGMETKTLTANYRVGYATNSSSAHSILYAKPGTAIADDLYCDFEYGRENFTLASREEKLKYVFVHLARGLRSTQYENIILANAMLGTNFFMENGRPVVLGDDENDFYINHQSKVPVPTPRGETTTMGDYVDYLLKAIVNDPQVVILGGNDEDEDAHPRLGDCQCTSPPPFNDHYCDDDEFSFIADPNGHLTFFGKVKTRTVNLKTGLPSVSATIPELVDLKITNACNKGCPWCMEDSTPAGIHASNLTTIAYMLGTSGVFEVAIGGGEPTLHPKFSDFLQACHSCGVTPNFSTGTMEWLQDETIREAVVKYCGAVAYSTQSVTEAKQWVDATEALECDTSLHFIVGLDSGDSLTDMLNAMMGSYYPQTRIVLLGQKQRGRYASHVPANGQWWKLLKNAKHHKKWLRGWLAVDSSLVPDVEANFPDVDPRTYEISDGRFSMYWDAVKSEVGASSHLPGRIPVKSLYDVFDNEWPQIVANTMQGEW